MTFVFYKKVRQTPKSIVAIANNTILDFIVVASGLANCYLHTQCFTSDLGPQGSDIVPLERRATAGRMRIRRHLLLARSEFTSEQTRHRHFP